MRGVHWAGIVAVVVVVAASASACGSNDVTPAVAPTNARAEAGAETAPPSTPAALCVDGKPVAWPPGPYEVALTSVLPPDLAWDGPDGPIRIKDYFEPCAPQSRLLIVRTSGAWCGSCGWHATHTKRLIKDSAFAARLELLDLLVSDEDNMPPDVPAATRWRSRIDAPGKVGIDTKYTFSTVLGSKDTLPEYVIVDTRTMIVRTVVADPNPQVLEGYLAVELALLDGRPRPDIPSSVLYDGLLSEDQWDLVQGMKLPVEFAPPPDATNEYGDVAAAATLGKKLFNDVQLSPTGSVGCVTCHDPAKGFADARAQAVGVKTGERNSPSLALASHARWQFWDGRADTLWMQALGPFENAKEFDSSRLFVAHQIESRYAAEYDALFATKYPRPDLTGLPPGGKPGDAAYDALPQAKRDAIARVYVNVGKSIAAFERTVRVKPNALDAYAGGDKTALTAAQKTALNEFMKVGCVQCHWGPRMTDDAFHTLRFPTGAADGSTDRGRIDILGTLAAAEFVATSKFSDSPGSSKLLTLASTPSMLGAFKTPPLRGVAQTAPYGHGGSLATLLDVIKVYGERAKSVDATKATGTVEEWVPNFDANVQAQVPDLLKVLTADVEP
jgi:cytochrome c peroxidase